MYDSLVTIQYAASTPTSPTEQQAPPTTKANLHEAKQDAFGSSETQNGVAPNSTALPTHKGDTKRGGPELY